MTTVSGLFKDVLFEIDVSKIGHCALLRILMLVSVEASLRVLFVLLIPFFFPFSSFFPFFLSFFFLSEENVVLGKENYTYLLDRCFDSLSKNERHEPSMDRPTEGDIILLKIRDVFKRILISFRQADTFDLGINLFR